MNFQFQFLPSLLFTPANKPERFAKGIEAHATGIIIDLEDGVGVDQKKQAREIAFDYLKNSHARKLPFLLRINNIETSYGLEDLFALSQTSLQGCDGIIHPKTEDPYVLNLINTILTTYQQAKPLFPIIETAKGVKNVEKIVMRSKAIAGLMFGAADYSVDAGCVLKNEALLFARSKITNAAGLKKIACYDSPYFDFKNAEGLADETALIQSLGFTGKLAIHPNQLEIINHAFKPTLEAYTEAKEIMRLYDEAHGNAYQYKGKMIDVPIYKLAKRTVTLYETLA